MEREVEKVLQWTHQQQVLHTGHPAHADQSQAEDEEEAKHAQQTDVVDPFAAQDALEPFDVLRQNKIDKAAKWTTLTSGWVSWGVSGGLPKYEARFFERN